MENKELETQDTVMTPDVYRKTFWRTFPLQAHDDSSIKKVI